MGEDSIELSRFRAAAGACLSHFSFEGDIGAAAANLRFVRRADLCARHSEAQLSAQIDQVRIRPIAAFYFRSTNV
jgi:hypothetical protein